MTSLTDTYQRCVGWFLLATEIFENDSTMLVEGITLDGTLLIFWAQLVGLDKGKLDPQLTRFQRYIESELGELLSSFELSAEGSVKCELLKTDHKPRPSAAEPSSD
jgi:hypothetical protein